MNSALALVYGRLAAVRVSHTGPPRGAAIECSRKDDFQNLLESDLFFSST